MKLTSKQKQLVKEYISRLKIKSSLNEAITTNPEVRNIIKDFPRKLDDLFEEFKEKCVNINVDLDEDSYGKAIHKAGQHLDLAVEILNYIK